MKSIIVLAGYLWIIYILTFLPTTVKSVQSFREAPQNLSVIAGQTAILRCSVQDVKGQVQWVRGTVLLGYDRTIPGYPRYKMIGDKGQGEFNLMIENVRLEDDSLFECQVGPGGDDPHLQGHAYLTVLLPPETPTIEGYASRGVVKVPHDQTTLQLTCQALHGKPAGTLHWYRNNVEITEGVVSNITILADKRQNVKSVVTLTPKSEDNGVIFKCEVTSEALITPLHTQVNLSVMHPPDPPTISGYSTGDIVKTGDTVKLMCTSRGGYPLPHVHWYKNGLGLDYSFITTGQMVENELVFTVQPTDMNAEYQCEAANQVTRTPLSAEVKLTVQFAPDKVTITGHEKAKEGQTLDLKCESGISNPPAEITWFARGQQIQGATSEEKESPKGGYVTTSIIKVKLTDRENDVTYQCHATNPALGNPAVTAVTLQVMYKPGDPVISGYPEDNKVQAGDKLTMSCTSVGGNPLATLKWYKGDDEQQSTTNIAGNIVQSQIITLVEPQDNKGSFECRAKNDAVDKALKTSVTLEVLFRPSSLNITTDPAQIKAGQDVTIRCRSSSANPPSRLEWIKDGELIQGTDEGTEDAEFNGKSSISKLVLTPTAENNGEIYSCRAVTDQIDSSITDAVTLDVLFSPVFPDDVPTEVLLLEKESTTLNFTVDSNPGDVEYKFFKDGEKVKFKSKRRRDVNIPRFKLVGGAVVITEISRQDKGNYRVVAKNGEGKTDHNFSIAINYPAEIQSTSPKRTVQQGVTVVIDCVADANPLPDGVLTWSRDGYDMSRTAIESNGPKSVLTIAKAMKEDSGEFVCTANNSLGEPASKKVTVLVEFAPEIDKSPALGKSAADKGKKAILTCIAYGVPTVRFAWYKNDSLIDSSGGKYSIKDTNPEVTRFESELSVMNTSKEDYGEYNCTATNKISTDSNQIILDGTTVPDPPTDVVFINSTHNSITISWTPGFGGGAPQSFKVRYAQIDPDGVRIGGFTWKDVIPSNATVFKVTGLKRSSRYQLSVYSRNRLGDGLYSTPALIAQTSSGDSQHTNDTPLIIILTVSIIGMIVLGLNVLLILCFLRRRRKRMEKEASEGTSGSNTVEMYNAFTITGDAKSYTSYGGRSLDDFKDDPYNQFYQDEDEMHRFLNQGALESMYGRSRTSPYTTPNGYADYRTLSYPQSYPDPLTLAGLAGSRGGIVMDDQTAMASGLTPINSRPSLHPENYSHSPVHTLPNGVHVPVGRPARPPPPPGSRTSSHAREGSSPVNPQPPIPSRNYSAEEIPYLSAGSTHSSLSHNGHAPLLPPSHIRGALV